MQVVNSTDQNIEGLAERLFKLAGYSNISATSYMLNSNRHSFSPDKKVFLPVYINKYRAVGMLDSGSDLTLMSSSLFKGLKLRETTLITTDNPTLKCFGNQSIHVIGRFNCKIRLYKDHVGIVIPVFVINDNVSTPLLLGNDFLYTGQGALSYVGKAGQPAVSVTFNYPEIYSCHVLYVSPADIYNCSAHVSLGPNQSDDIEFTLNPAAPVLRTDHVLISSVDIENIGIIPSRSDFTFCQGIEAYTAQAKVINLTQ